MPIREYKCKNCGNYIEIIQGINEKPLQECPKCGGKLEKLISNTSFQLKGSGWYKTDYAASSGSKKKKEGTETREEPGAAKKEESKAPACACAGTCGHKQA